MKADRVVRSTCPYCGVGCQIDLNVKDDRIFRVDAPFDAAPNYGRLCVKGRFGTDFVHHPSRLTAPLIRRTPQTPGARTAAASPDDWREASWDEALDLVATRLLDLRDRYGPDSITANASAKATNEDSYLLQKYLRAVIGTNNIDHCARLCHAGSVAGLQLAIGSTAMSNAIAEMPDLECFMVIGSNTPETHPVIATFLKQAVRKNGARLIVVDPRQTEMTRFAELWLREKPGTDTALFNAMAQVIVAEKLYDEAFVAARTEGFEEYAAGLAGKTPEWAEAITGVPADDIRRAARIYAGAKAAAMYWGMGISQSTHGTDNTLTLTNLALLCGHIGRPGTGLNPLRGQNNVQGCSDVGGVPSFYTAYQPVTDPDDAREVRGGLGRVAARRARPDHDRDGGRHPDRPGQGVVRDGREPADERAEPGARPPRRRAARILRRPGHLLQRDPRLRRRDPARGQLCGEGRHLHQLRPPRPARAPSHPAARPGPRRLGDHRGSGATDDHA